MKEFRGGIIRLFEQGKSGYQIAKDHTEQKKLEIWSETSSLNASKSTSARSETMENGHRIRPIYAWNAIPQEVIDRAVDDFPKRLKKCIDVQGGHFENK
uniref:Uncharacterized protein n=1 Tax=Acrobeloides nanus TaxID=290746 RepID=A0A914D3P0_9BILA